MKKRGTLHIEIEGLNKIVTALRSKHNASTKAMNMGLYMAGVHLQGVSQQMVPVEHGLLKASAFTRDVSTTKRAVVLVGYTNENAAYVHEQVQMKWRGKKRKGTRADGLARKGRYWDPSGKAQAKFLERPFKSEFSTMFRIIENTIKQSLKNG